MIESLTIDLPQLYSIVSVGGSFHNVRHIDLSSGKIDTLLEHRHVALT